MQGLSPPTPEEAILFWGGERKKPGSTSDLCRKFHNTPSSVTIRLATKSKKLKLNITITKINKLNITVNFQ